MSPKVCYLLTSPGKFQQQHGNGSSNMESHGTIGKKIAAILRKNNDLSFELENTTGKEPWPFPSDDMSEVDQKGTSLESGMCGETVTSTAKCCGNQTQLEVLWSWWKI